MKSFVKLFKALSDESRQKILLLLDKGSLSVSEIAKKTKLSQPNTSGHLTELKNAGLVTSSRMGNSKVFSIDKKWVTICCGDFLCK
jgi:ArsR family transcriptional regulator